MIVFHIRVWGIRFVNTYLECIFLYSFQRWEREKERWFSPYLNVTEGAVVKYYLVFERKNRCSLCREKKITKCVNFLSTVFLHLNQNSKILRNSGNVLVIRILMNVTICKESKDLDRLGPHLNKNIGRLTDKKLTLCNCSIKMHACGRQIN